jgi:hypothetical protein
MEKGVPGPSLDDLSASLWILLFFFLSFFLYFLTAIFTNFWIESLIWKNQMISLLDT